jgi:lipid II:glycine glycyltransferase (peptidoglycan interpeptide bridge formation enzyme)
MTDFIDIGEDKKENYNKVVSHPLQSFEWGEFRKKTGVKVIRRGLVRNNKIIDGFTLTLHKIPRTKFYIGYLPKGNEPTEELIEELKRIGRENNCIFIQLEPNIKISNFEFRISNFGLRPAAHPLFTKYTFVLDITKSEEELLKNMHPKTRYNIRVAEKHKVKVIEDNSEKSFEQYLKLMMETTNRQRFYAHTPSYHRNMFEVLNRKSSIVNRQSLTYHLLNAIYNSKVLTSWVVFVFKDTIYYPYGASSRENREVMANNLIAWEAIRFGKKLGLKYFDMWGALGPEPDKNDPWYGFHRFKEGYGAELVEFVGSYDLVINRALYEIYKIADKLRWTYLRLKNLI